MTNMNDWLPCGCGDTVVDRGDERHQGRVEAVIDGAVARVRWHDTGWLSDLPLRAVHVVRTAEHEARERRLCGGYLREELQAAFELVCDERDWRAGIDTVIDGVDDELLRRVHEAVRFFTATEARSYRLEGGRVAIMADGYRAGPAGC